MVSVWASCIAKNVREPLELIDSVASCSNMADVVGTDDLGT